jgi:hypothetical protein
MLGFGMEQPFSNPALFLPAAFVVVVLVLVVTILSSRSSKKLDYPYERHDALFTPAERSFMGVLHQALGDEYQVFAKVRLSDLVKVRAGLSNSRRQSAFNRIASKHVDFVLCTPHDYSVVCAIELDDSSHQQARRRQRDDFVNKTFGVAGIPLVRLPVKHSYSVHDVQATLAAALSQETFAASRQAKRQAGALAADAQAASPLPAPVRCPECGKNMVVRTAKRGDNVGEEFLGCSAYPKCRKTMTLN